MNKMSSIQLLSLLKVKMLNFMDELIAVLPDEKDFLVMRFFIKDQVPIIDIMEYIVEKLVPLEHFVESRDDRFFLDNQVLFEGLKEKQSKANYFKDVWKNSDDQDNKEMIWKWFAFFINIGKKYTQLMESEG